MVRGGYQEPSNPAPTGLPGALSKRTDGGPSQPLRYISGLPQGQGQETYDNQTKAKVAGTPYSSMKKMANITPLDATTQFEDEPGTTGIDVGEGGGSELMMDRPSTKSNPRDTVAKLAMFDETGEAELIYQQMF
jgi:hypothetical protein